MRAQRQKIGSTSGFTLAETLIAVLILLMVSAVVAGGVPAALNAYRNAIDAANASTLLSTTVNALRDELSTAWDVENVPDSNTELVYTSADTGSRSRIYKKEENGQHVIMLQEYDVDAGAGWLKGEHVIPTAARPLISNAMRQTTRQTGEYMQVSYDTITYQNGYVTVTGLKVTRGSGDSETTLAEMPEDGLLIRVMTGGEGA